MQLEIATVGRRVTAACAFVIGDFNYGTRSEFRASLCLSCALSVVKASGVVTSSNQYAGMCVICDKKLGSWLSVRPFLFYRPNANAGNENS